MKTHKATLLVPKATSDLCKKLLSEGKVDDQTAVDGVIFTFTAMFSDGREADIKVCNAETEGGGPWVDAVLFEASGHEIEALEPGDSLLGRHEWILEDEDKKYVVAVRAGRSRP